MSRPIHTVMLYRENKHLAPQPWRDVIDVVLGSLLVGLVILLTIMVLA